MKFFTASTVLAAGHCSTVAAQQLTRSSQAGGGPASRVSRYTKHDVTKQRSKASKDPTTFPSTPMPGECGSTITEDFVLEKDLLDCDCLPIDNESGYALRVAGRNVTLNLNGYTVKCPSGFGQPCIEYSKECDSVIQVDGTGNTVQGPGFVKSGTNFDNTYGTGIKLVGGGSHVVDNVSVGPIEYNGIEVSSSNNVVSNCHVFESKQGISIMNGPPKFSKISNNIIRSNTIVDIKYTGIDIFSLSGLSDTQVLDNSVFSSSRYGIDNQMTERTIIRGNTINGNSFGGINDYLGDNTIIDSNTVTNNGFSGGVTDAGIFLGSRGSDGLTVTVIKNIAVANGVNGTNNFVIYRDDIKATVAGNIFETQPAPSP